MSGVFGAWQPKYADHNIPTFPVQFLEGVKKPAIRHWQKAGLRFSAKLTAKFGDAEALGFCCGRPSGITVLDVDTSDDKVLADALNRHGQTPIVVRSGSGNWQAWYAANDEGRHIRPNPSVPIDILGGGFCVAPPSIGTRGPYQLIQGTLDDLDRLPVMQNLEAAFADKDLSRLRVPTREGGRIPDGMRGTELFKHCMRQARHCDNLEALVDVARTFNADALGPPKPDDVVVKTARSAWGYEERGENWVSRPRVSVSKKELDLPPQALWLLCRLHFLNGPNAEFMIANGFAKHLGWSENMLRTNRKRLLEAGYIRETRPAAPPHQVALYRWARI